MDELTERHVRESVHIMFCVLKSENFYFCFEQKCFFVQKKLLFLNKKALFCIKKSQSANGSAPFTSYTDHNYNKVESILPVMGDGASLYIVFCF